VLGRQLAYLIIKLKQELLDTRTCVWYYIVKTNISSGGDAIGSTARTQLAGIPRKVFN